MNIETLLRTSNYVNYNRLATADYSRLKSAAIVLKGALEIIACHDFGRRSEPAVECNICHWRGRKFIDFYSGYGHVYENAVCPACYSHPRHRSYSISLREIFSDLPGTPKVLHFAPERQITSILTGYKNIDYLSVDIDHRKAMRREDIQKLSFQDNSFDAIICIHVFEHIEDDKQAMKEVYRVLKPGGVALLDVPIDDTRETTYEDPGITTPEGRTEAFWQWDHLRLYGLDYPAKLRDAGFLVEQKNYVESEGPDNVRKHGLEIAPNYLCYKPVEKTVKGAKSTNG